MYIRVSKVGERDPEALRSPDIQLDAAKYNCEKKNKRIVKVLVDMDKSGRDFSTRRVSEAIRLIKAGKAKSVTLWKWSRWGRNVEFSKAYLREVRAAGGRVDSATEDFDQESAIGNMMRGQVMLYDEFLSDMISEGWQAAQNRRRADGLPHSGRARFGYRYLDRAALKAGETHDAFETPAGIVTPGSDECSMCRSRTPHFWPNESYEALVELYEQYVQGVGCRGLSIRLNKRGFRTAFGGLWTQQSVGQMLDTGFGAGLIRERSPELLAQHKAIEEEAGKKVIRNSLATFDVWRTGAHPPVISADLWKRYYERRVAQATVPRNGATHPMSSLLFCEICSRRLRTKYAGKKRQHQWLCPWKDTFHPEVSVSLSDSAAMRIVRDWVRENADPLSAGPSLDELARARLAVDDSGVRTQAQIQKEIDEETAAHDKLILMNARGRINDEQFDIATGQIKETLAGLRIEMDRTTAAHGAVGKPAYTAFKSLDAVWDETLELEAARRELESEREAPGLNAPLRELVAFVIVSPAAGRNRWHDAAERVEIVGTWERESKDRWIEARRRRFSA